MSLIPKNVTDINHGLQSPSSRKQYIYNFLDSSLDENQLVYYTHCINRLNAIRALTAQNNNSVDSKKITKDDMQVDEIPYSEMEIKFFIVIQNSSLFSPIEYQELYNRYIEGNKKVRQVC